MCFLGILSGKIYLTGSGAGRSRQSLSDHVSCLQCIRFKGRMQKLIQGFGFNSKDSLFRGYHTFVHQVTGDL